MITVEQWHTIRCLHQRGISSRQIARDLRVSRNTVRRALAASATPEYSRTAPVTGETELAAFIRDCLRQGLRGSRILVEARTRQGYTGSQASFYRLLRQLQAEAATPSASQRFETGPGEQAQFDWAEYEVSLGGARTKLYVYALVLGYSRRCHWFPSLGSKQPAVFEALEAGWRHYQGACRELVVDNARCFVTKHTRAELVWHPLFLRLCGHYRVQPIAATPRRPQSKGKVENPFGLLERHFIQGGSWSSFTACERALGEHEARWEERLHGTTGVSPRVRFVEEQPALIPLPPMPFLGVSEMVRQVSRDCLVSYQGVRYSVPAPYAGKQVWLRPTQGHSVTVLSAKGVPLATHTVPPAGVKLVVCPEHYEGLRRRHTAALPTLTARFRALYGSLGAEAETFLQRFLGQATQAPERELSRLLELFSTAPEPQVLQVLTDGLEFNLLTRAFLEARLDHHRRQAAPAAAPLALPLQAPLPFLDVEGPLGAYGRALPQD
ncbi:MAG: IS21 family transposase [Actinomycetota bacterium]